MTTHANDDVEARLDRLERELRRWRRAAVVAGGVLGLVALVGATTPKGAPVADEVQAKREALVASELDAHVTSSRCYRNSIVGSREPWTECALTLRLGQDFRDLPGGRLPDRRVLKGTLVLSGLPDSEALRLLTDGDPMRVRLTVERP